MNPIDLENKQPLLDFSVVKFIEDEIHSAYHSFYPRFTLESYCTQNHKCPVYPPYKIPTWKGQIPVFPEYALKPLKSTSFKSTPLSQKKEFYLGLSTPYEEKKYASALQKKINQGSAQLPKDPLRSTYLRQIISDFNKPKKPPLEEKAFDPIGFNCAEEDYWYDEY